MLNVILSNGESRQFPEGYSGFDVAKSISTSLAKSALAIKINGDLVDLNCQIKSGDNLEIITETHPLGKDMIQHDGAHIMAQALMELYADNNIKLAIGPTIENGFYYDFECDVQISEADLPKIEKQMYSIVKRNLKIERDEWAKEKALKYFQDKGESYKVEIINDLPDGETISVYTQGDFVDLCRGPHAPTTGKVKAVKLLKIAGAYWRGDSNNKMLQRIYGTAWSKKTDLEEYLHMIEEAEKRDHRKLGKAMELFHFQEHAPGAVFWHHKGWTLFRIIQDYMREILRRGKYIEISTPDMLDRAFWEDSGHWQKFGENMFVVNTQDERTFAMKPMNCPGGVQVYKQGVKSYRNLPLRISEFGKVHRYEPSGALHGLMRCRTFTQDDAHVFCTEEQILDESKQIFDAVLKIYNDFGFDKIHVKFSDRPEKRIGSDETWDKSEQALLEAIKYAGLEYTWNKGEGAFYGPKVEFVLKDAIGRDWQLGTLQLDFNLPARLGATYTDEQGNKKPPVMLHRALLGSFERFLGILLEHYAGNLPLWLAPTQFVIATISEQVEDYAQKVYDTLIGDGLRVELDNENQKINYKIREHSLAKVPVIVIIGKKEAELNEVSIRELGSEKQFNMSLEEFKKVYGEKAQSPLKNDDINKLNI